MKLAAWYTPRRLGGVEAFLHRYARHERELAIAATTALDGPIDLDAQLLDWTAFGAAFNRKAPSAPVCAQLQRDLNALRPQVININDCLEFGIGAAPLLRRLKPYATIVDVMHIDHPDDAFLENRRPYLGALDGIIATSRHAIERFRAYHRTELPARYIPCGIELAPAHRTPPDGPLHILYVGRLVEEQKRVMLIPEVLRAVRRPYRLTVVGDGPDRARLQEALPDATFTGFVDPDRVAPLYASSDILLNVSGYEGFAVTVMEAFAAGCVPLLTPLDSLDRELLRDGENCFLVPVEGMAAVLSTVSREQLALMSARAKDAAPALSIERTVAAYDDFFAQLGAAKKPWRDVKMRAWDISAENPWMPSKSLTKRIGARLRKWRRA
jgi:glycosyltransferase involved in cell wall biosynthesis